MRPNRAWHVSPVGTMKYMYVNFGGQGHDVKKYTTLITFKNAHIGKAIKLELF